MAGGNKGDQVQVKVRGNILSYRTYASGGTAVAASFRGTMVNINDEGFALQGADLSGANFAGIAEEAIAAETVTNQAGAPFVRVRRKGIFKMKLDGTSKAAAPTLVGELVYVHTAQAAAVDELVGLSANVSNYVLVGKIVKHGTDAEAAAGTSSDEVWVDIMGVAHTTLGDATYPTLANLLDASDVAKGAILVGLYDVLTYYAAVTVEAGLAEARNRTATLMSATGAQDITAPMQHKGVILVPNTAALTLTLITPTLASEKGLTVTVIKTTSDAEIITIDTESSETIDGAATYTALDAQYDTATFIWDGAAWNVSDFGEIYAKLALTSNGNGAALIGIEDAYANYAGANAEAVLAEIGGVAYCNEFTIQVGPIAIAADCGTIFVATKACTVKAISEVHGTAAGQTATLQVERAQGTEANGAGDDLLTDNANAGFDLEGTADTVQAGTLTGTGANLILAAGDRLNLVDAGTLTTLADMCVTVTLAWNVADNS